jgi:cyclophilin family peptidyl-prolyl cis-trans isomerase
MVHSSYNPRFRIMKSFTKRVWDLFRRRRPQAAISRRPRRLELEALEDRSVPAGSASGALIGVAFVDANANGILDAHLKEGGVPGISVRLTGTTSLGADVNVVTTTDGGGGYAFPNILPGRYGLRADPGQGLLGGIVSVPGRSIGAGKTVILNTPLQGLAPEFVSLRQLLTSTTVDDFPFANAGSGRTLVNPRENNLPFVQNAIGDVSASKNDADRVIDLAGHFSDPDFTNSQIRFKTSRGGISEDINVVLFDTQAPRTVANFFNYIKDNRFDDTIFHRMAKTAGVNFVLQGGGFKFVEGTQSDLDPVEIDRTVQNEFSASRSNTLGTIAMAKVGNDPNSATSQFFFNLGDNSSNLDNQNGGFTVFGELVDDLANREALNRLAATPTQDRGGAFNEIPLANNYSGNNFPSDLTAAHVVMVTDVEIVRQDEFLSYAVVSNSNENVVTATIDDNNRLVLGYGTATGEATITVRATDRFGATAETSFKVTVSNRPPTASVDLTPATPDTDDLLTATVTASDPDQDAVILKYVWKVNGAVVKTTANTSALTDTLDLSVAGQGDAGDNITVEVTPHDGTIDGALASDVVTIV